MEKEQHKDIQKNKISIAVLMSTYNGEKYLAEQIDSILGQQGDFELRLFIRDDGSADSTREILGNYKSSENIVVFCEGNVGITESYFRLIHYVREQWNPDYYSLSDQDDVWLPEKLQCAVKALEKEKNNHEVGFPLLYGCRSYLVNEKLEKTGQLTQKQLRPLTIYNTAIQNILLGHNQVFNDVLANELCSKELDYSQIYAHDMWITQVASVVGKIVFENVPHTLYRQHGKNELGYGSGAGTIKWLFARVQRVAKGESRLIGRQTRFFFEEYGKVLSSKEECRLKSFFSVQNKIGKRCLSLMQSKLYRQRKAETILFAILFVMNRYG